MIRIRKIVQNLILLSKIYLFVAMPLWRSITYWAWLYTFSSFRQNM